MQETQAASQCAADHAGGGAAVAKSCLLCAAQPLSDSQPLLHSQLLLGLVWVCAVDLLEHCEAPMFPPHFHVSFRGFLQHLTITIARCNSDMIFALYNFPCQPLQLLRCAASAHMIFCHMLVCKYMLLAGLSVKLS